ncbi:MAG: hypothetical protein ACI9MB_002322, partial [Verrucomicrobiales bacterium]
CWSCAFVYISAHHFLLEMNSGCASYRGAHRRRLGF